MTEIKHQDLDLQKVRIEDVVDYLLANGWIEKLDYPNTEQRIFIKESIGTTASKMRITLPSSIIFEDAYDILSNAIRHLARLKKVEPIELLFEIVSPALKTDFDNIRLLLPNEALFDGVPTFEVAWKQLNALRNVAGYSAALEAN